MMTLTTAEMLALRLLNRVPDQRWVDWALTMLENGEDSPALRVLAGETAPFVSFEIWDLADRVFAELGLSPAENEDAARRTIARLILREIIDGEVPADAGLGTIVDIYETGELGPLSECYDLYHMIDESRGAPEHWYYDIAADEVPGYVIERCREILRLSSEVDGNPTP